MGTAFALLLLAGLPVFCNAVEALPRHSTDPHITDFRVAHSLREATANEPAYSERLRAYRMCSETELRRLIPYRIRSLNDLTYTAVRGCTREREDYARAYQSDPRFRAHWQVSLAIMKLVQAEQIDALAPLARQLQVDAGRSRSRSAQILSTLFPAPDD